MGEKLASLDRDDRKEPTLSRAIGSRYDAEGIDFSGGELQKVALARALYKNAPFVVDFPAAASVKESWCLIMAVLYRRVRRMP